MRNTRKKTKRLEKRKFLKDRKIKSKKLIR